MFWEFKNKGFSIIELTVTVAIFALITTVALVKNSQFDSSVKLSNAAYEVGLLYRQAQVYGVSVREADEGVFSSGYGIHISTGNQSSFRFFADDIKKTIEQKHNYLYKNENEDKTINVYELGGGYTIKDFCITPSFGSEDCGISELNVVYERPNSDAHISDGGDEMQSARIIIQSPRGGTKEIILWSTGQISIQ